MRITETTSDGHAIMFQESMLEKAMQRFLTLRYTIDESRRKKRNNGYYIYIRELDHPFIAYNFITFSDARFVLELIVRKIPKMKTMNMRIERKSSKKRIEKKWVSQELPKTKFEVEGLDNEARREIWRKFKP